MSEGPGAGGGSLGPRAGQHVPATGLACHGCGATHAAEEAWPFRCGGALPGDDIDHLVVRTLDTARVPFPVEGDPNPFIRWRELLHAWQVWRAAGRSDAEWIDLVGALDAAVQRVDGVGFRETPLILAPGTAAAVGLAPGARLLLKDETGNVSGSHKARHLFGLMIWLTVAERLGWSHERPPLAIASCGNAALAAAVVARAAERPLDVFIPPSADPAVVARLADLGARVAACPREPGVAGDPCYHRFQAALAAGALPFCCQGPDNGLTVEGGHTIGWELAAAIARAGGGADGADGLDRVLIQVGGGALASAVIAGLREAVALGALPHMPRIHAVQTEGGHPLARAWERFEGHRRDNDTSVGETLAWATTHRSQLMWAWETEPHSVAHGILDDETYDWLAIVRGMAETGGWPLVVSEAELVRATALANGAGVPADETGASGLAGLLRLQATAPVGAESVAVLLTGHRR